METKNVGEEHPKKETESKVPFKIPGPPPNLKRTHVFKAAEDDRRNGSDKVPVENPEKHADIPDTKSYSASNDRCPFAEFELSLEEFKVPFNTKAASSLPPNPTNKPKIPVPAHNNNNQTTEVYDHPLRASSLPQNPTNNQEVVVSAHNNNNNNHQTISRDFSVCYSRQNGGVAVISDTSVPQPDGTQAIRTSQYQAPSPSQYESDRPLTKRYQRILKILSVVAAIVFFPTGIPAAYYAFKTEKEFNDGIFRGDISLAQKYGKRAEKFIIFSYLLCVMVIILSFTVHERSKWNDSEWAGHRIMPG